MKRPADPVSQERLAHPGQGRPGRQDCRHPAGQHWLEAIEAEPELRDSFKELKQYSDNVTSFMDLEVGRIDAVVVAQTTAAYFIKKNNAPFRIIDVGYPDIPSGVGMRKDDTELKARIDKVLEDMHNDGTSKKISEKWFGIDVTM